MISVFLKGVIKICMNTFSYLLVRICCLLTGVPAQPGQLVWMPVPQAPIGCPPGLEYLACIDQVLVQQQVELLEGQSMRKLFLLITVVRTYMCTYLPTYLPTYIPTYLHTYIHNKQTYIPTYLPTYIHTYIHNKHTYLHTYLHTYIHN